MDTPIPSYRCHRYAPEIIVQCVRLYFRFPLSRRGIEELMFERGIIVSYESTSVRVGIASRDSSTGPSWTCVSRSGVT